MEEEGDDHTDGVSVVHNVPSMEDHADNVPWASALYRGSRRTWEIMRVDHHSFWGVFSVH